MLDNIKRDYERRTELSGMKRKANIFRVLFEAFRDEGFRAVFFYRIGRWCRARKLSIIAAFVERLMRHMSHCWISTLADIGPGFVVAHVCGIVIPRGVWIGKNCTIRHNASLAGNYKKREPDGRGGAILGDDISIGPGAVILGPITVGSNTIIGANAVVTTSVPPNSVVGVFRAEVLAQRSPEGNIVHSDSDKNIFLSRREIAERLQALEQKLKELSDRLSNSKM